MDLSVFLASDNLVFFLILLGIAGVLIVVCFIIVRAIIRLIKALIKKFLKKKEKGHAMEGALTDKGEDISLEVEELEKSKRETAVAKALQYSEPIKPREAKEKISEEKEKEQEEIESGLEKLKHPEEAGEKKSFLEQQAEKRRGGEFMPKIKIPVSKKVEVKEPEVTKEQPREKPKDEAEEKPEPEAAGKVQPKKEPSAAEAPAGLKPEKTEKQEFVEEKTLPKGPRALGDDLIKERKLPEKQEEGSPIDGAKSGQQSKEPQAEPEKHVKIRSVQHGLQNFASRIFGRKQKDKIESEEKESIPLYEKPEFIKDQLVQGEKKGKQDEQEKIEEELEELKHHAKEWEKRSFLKEQIKTKQEERIEKMPIPEKPEVPIVKENLSGEKTITEEPAEVQAQRAKQSGSPLKRAQSQQTTGFQAKEDVFQQHKAPELKSIKQQEEAKIEEEIPLYDKPEFMKDELGVGERQKARREQKLQGEPIAQAGVSRAGQKKSEIPIYEKPEFMKDEPLAGRRQRNAKTPEKTILFGDKNEISRPELRRKLRIDADVWKAQKDVRLNLKPGERVKLEKQFFGKIYGRNISKADVKKNLRRMGKEWVSTSNMQKRETLRRQIKFLKNISGIKNPYK